MDKITEQLDHYLNFLSEDLHTQLTGYTGKKHRDGSSCALCTTEEYLKRNTTSITNEIYKISKDHPAFAYSYCLHVHQQFAAFLMLSEFLLKTMQDLYEDDE